MTTRTLVKRAAAGQRLRVRHDIGFNRDAAALLHRGQSAVEEIESFLADRSAEDFFLIASPPQPLRGLADLYHAYFRLTKDHRRAGQFLLSLHGAWREEAVRAILIHWGPASRGQNGGLPAWLRGPLELLSRFGSPGERDLCHRVLESARGAKAIQLGLHEGTGTLRRKVAR